MPRKIVYIELPAADGARARAFWSSLLDAEMRGVEGAPYHMFDGEPGGGIYESDELAGTGPFVYFGSDDIEADIARTRELGGAADDKQPVPGIGWYARCRDPEGNAFSLFESDESVAASGPAPGE